jgi:hypothetical protein
LSLRTHNTVVPCICALSSLFRIPPLYSRDGSGQRQGLSLSGARNDADLVVGFLFFFFFLLFFFGFAAADFLEALLE